MWQCLLCPHLWTLAGWSSYGLWIPSGAITCGMDAWNLLISQTFVTQMKKLMLSFGYSQIHDLARGKVMGVGLSLTLIASSLNLSLAVAPDLILGTLSWGHILAPPIMQQLLGGLLVMETGLDCRSWMVSTQVEWSEDVQALTVWCILWWWLWQSATSLHPGLPDWH